MDSSTATPKRNRACNWDEDEKRLLRELVTARLDVIENKDTTKNNNSAKKIAWKEVLNCFNSINTKQRDMTQIVNQWRNTKNQLKLKDSQYRRARLETGGGPPPTSPPPEDVAIMQAMPNEFVVDNNTFDSDTYYTKTKMQTTKSPGCQIDSDLNSNIEVATLETTQSAELSQEKPIVKIVDKERKTIKKIKQSRSHNVSSVDYENELFTITIDAKKREMEHGEELHRKRMTILELEEEYWKKKNTTIV